MYYRWFEIRKKIIAACKKTYDEQNMSISISDIEAATDLYDRVMSYPLQFYSVANLQADLQQSLEGAFIEHVGSSADLRNVQNLLDSYLKKILVMSGIKTITDILRTEPTLKILLQDTGTSSTFSGIAHKITDSNISVYDKDPTGAYILCKAYLGRNTVHESREMDPEDVYRSLRYAIATYVLVTLHLSPILLGNFPNLNKGVKIDLSEINETGYVYDFINYGNTSNKIKNRIVESFILNYVHKVNGSVSVDSLVREVELFSRQSLNVSSIKNIINKLIPDKLSYDNYNKVVTLNEKEKERLQTALDNYSLLVSRLLSEIENLLDSYGFKEKTQEVYNKLKKFFEDNCLSIINMMKEVDGEACGERSEEYINEFKSFLKKNGCPEEKLDDLFRDLLRVCSMNDILVKIALGKNFSNISDPDALTTGLKSREKKVYLDTQILLYALCDYDDFEPFNGSPSFLIVKSLISVAKQNPNIHLATIGQYVIEVAYHLKRAIQLVVFDEIYHNSKIKLSDNVFYSYYYYLKDKGLLNDNINTLEEFLGNMFDVSYDDILSGNFESQIYSFIAEILIKDYGIEVEDTPYYADNEIENSHKIFTTALLGREENRSPSSALKDAIMGLYLFTNGQSIASEPFFLSWDKTFYAYRKDYIKTYMKNSVTSWHLFSPAKFVNHLNLLEMKIDVDVLTEDLISIIEDDDTASNTKKVLDSIRKLLEKSNVNSRHKRKAYSEIIFNETEFPNDIVLPEEKSLKLINDFALTFDKVLTKMQTDSHNFGDFADIISNENRFKEIVSKIRKRLATENVDQCANAMFDEILHEVQK